MDNELKIRLEEQEKKIDAIYISVEKTRKYILWTVIATVVMFVLPLIGLVLLIPTYLKMIANFGI